MKPILETTVDDVRGPLEFSVLGAVAAVEDRRRPDAEAARGTILFTTGGAAINPYPLRAGVGISFAGEVAYAGCSTTSSPTRASTSPNGDRRRIAPGEDHEPDDVAELLWSHHTDRRRSRRGSASPTSRSVP